MWLSWGRYDLASIVLVNRLQWQGIGKCLHFHHPSFFDRGTVHSSQNCSHVEVFNSRLKTLVIFFTFRWFLKSWWVFTCTKILKNNVNKLFSSISSCILPTRILCSHSKVKSPALGTSAVSCLCKDHKPLFYTSKPGVHMGKAHHWGIVSNYNPGSKCCLVRFCHSGFTRRQ